MAPRMTFPRTLLVMTLGVSLGACAASAPVPVSPPPRVSAAPATAAAAPASTRAAPTAAVTWIAKADQLLAVGNQGGAHFVLRLPGTVIESSEDGARWRIDGHEVGIAIVPLTLLGLAPTATNEEALKAQIERQVRGMGDALGGPVKHALVRKTGGDAQYLASMIPVAAARAEPGVGCIVVTSIRLGDQVVALASTRPDCDDARAMADLLQTVSNVEASPRPIDPAHLRR